MRSVVDSLVLYWDSVYKTKGREWLVEGRQRKDEREKRGEYASKARAEELTRQELQKEDETLRTEVAYLKN